MSIQHISQVIENSKARGTAKLVMILIANHADKNGIAWPSIGRIAQQANVDRSNVKKAIKRLCESGELTIIGQGMSGVNRYQITIESPTENDSNTDQITDERGGENTPSEGEGENTPPGRIHTTPRGENAPSVGAIAPPKPSRTVNEPSLSCAREDEFERFWNAYPKREGGDPKKPTLKKFEIACRKTDPENIIHAAEQYAARIEQEEAENPRRKPRRFVPMAKTWLHQERWEEYPRENPDDVHRLKMRKLAEDIWPSMWGPRPGEPGCDIPPHILQEFGMEGVLQ